MRNLSEIIIHCTDTRPEWWSDRSSADKVAEVRRWHVEERKWSDVGSHYLIDRDGTVIEGRPLERVGAHVKNHNTGTIGISLFGGHGGASTDDFFDNFTEDQDRALRTLINKLRDDYPSITKVTGHNAYASKACPTFSVSNWIAGTAPKPVAEEPQGRTSITQSRTAQATVVQAASAATAGVTAVSALDGTAQLVMIGAVALVAIAALFILKERIVKWKAGVR